MNPKPSEDANRPPPQRPAQPSPQPQAQPPVPSPAAIMDHPRRTESAPPNPPRSPATDQRSSQDPGQSVSQSTGHASLLSDNSNSAVSGAFNALAHTILAQNARTLEDLVSEMLRPMLKEWLDDNLPSLVERLVKEEIERVSRGRR